MTPPTPLFSVPADRLALPAIQRAAPRFVDRIHRSRRLRDGLRFADPFLVDVVPFGHVLLVLSIFSLQLVHPPFRSARYSQSLSVLLLFFFHLPA